ncbi:polymer-forming cytoskeletal protein [Nitrosococcus wardiae]|uniref:Polymer-forming cytoskeletal protein n=2 Tax=Nitrosococcus wardiae TaxID=1814290 RepID=A0A4P7C688_9GAMM|nr:polymer-forming cytoskeletal protein [Nitrosococcus wardiae]
MFKFQKKSKRRIQLDTLIGEYTRLEGNITFSGGLRVEGYIKGDVIAEDEDSLLTISQDGAIEGQVKVPYIILSGSVTGDVHASERIDLAHQARIHGDVYYHFIEMAVGAKINGSLIHMEEKQIPNLKLAAGPDIETPPPVHGLKESHT